MTCSVLPLYLCSKPVPNQIAVADLRVDVPTGRVELGLITRRVKRRRKYRGSVGSCGLAFSLPSDEAPDQRPVTYVHLTQCPTKWSGQAWDRLRVRA